MLFEANFELVCSETVECVTNSQDPVVSSTDGERVKAQTSVLVLLSSQILIALMLKTRSQEIDMVEIAGETVGGSSSSQVPTPGPKQYRYSGMSGNPKTTTVFKESCLHWFTLRPFLGYSCKA